MVVVDGQPLFRASIARAVRQSTDVRLVAEATSGRAGLAAILSTAPDVAVVDVDAPDLDGLGVLAGLARAQSPARVLLLAADIPPHRAYAGVLDGAAGCISRTITADELRAAVVAAAHGETVLDDDAQTALAAAIVARRDERRVLTPRQLRILRLVADGRRTAEIAAMVRASRNSVKSELATIYERLEVRDRTSAVAAALRRGLIQ